MKEDVHLLAPIPIYVKEDMPALTEPEYRSLVNLPEHMALSDGNNFISNNRHILDLPVFVELKRTLVDSLNHFVKNIMQLDTEFYITNSWSTRNPPGTRHSEHYHAHSIFSGIYYVDVEDGDIIFSANSQFSRDYKFRYNVTQYNPLNSNIFKLSPKPGMLIIFPSWVNHQVTENKENKDRRIIGFNAFVKGRFGNDEDITLLDIR
jgi:uncharacterized protein (TIGR02466 family)